MIYLGNQPVGNTEVIGSFTPGALETVAFINDSAATPERFELNCATQPYAITGGQVVGTTDLVQMNVTSGIDGSHASIPNNCYVFVHVVASASVMPILSVWYEDASMERIDVEGQSQSSSSGNRRFYDFVFAMPEGPDTIYITLEEGDG